MSSETRNRSTCQAQRKLIKALRNENIKLTMQRDCALAHLTEPHPAPPLAPLDAPQPAPVASSPR